MTDRELMQMALDAMESFENGTNGLYKGEFAEERKALRERLNRQDFPLKRKWVGLTDTEVLDISKSTSVYGSDNHYEVLEFVASIEAKLKEKNT